MKESLGGACLGFLGEASGSTERAWTLRTGTPGLNSFCHLLGARWPRASDFSILSLNVLICEVGTVKLHHVIGEGFRVLAHEDYGQGWGGRWELCWRRPADSILAFRGTAVGQELGTVSVPAVTLTQSPTPDIGAQHPCRSQVPES